MIHQKYYTFTMVSIIRFLPDNSNKPLSEGPGFPREGIIVVRSLEEPHLRGDGIFSSCLSEPRADFRAGLSSSTDPASDTTILYLLLRPQISLNCTWWVCIHPRPAPNCNANHFCPGCTVC